VELSPARVILELVLVTAPQRMGSTMKLICIW
jgi:hypothetical protein